MSSYPKSILIMISIVACTAFVVELLHRLPSYGPVANVAPTAAPAQLMSTIDLQRELNRLYPDLKLKEDGVYGPLTQAAHERAIGDQYAKELMVRRVK